VLVHFLEKKLTPRMRPPLQLSTPMVPTCITLVSRTSVHRPTSSLLLRPSQPFCSHFYHARDFSDGNTTLDGHYHISMGSWSCDLLYDLVFPYFFLSHKQMSASHHLRWLFPLIMFFVIIALIVGLVLGIPISTGPHLTDKPKNKKTDFNFFFFL
jgi:hypothetical protein